MALPPNPDPLPPAGTSGLPASYRNPWLTLGENLAAVAADLRLRARELVRRNREGGLWRPGWWPRDLAPLFWPLLLALLLGLLLAVVFGAAEALRRFAPAAPVAAPVQAPPAASAEPPAPVSEPVATAEPNPTPEVGPPADPEAEPLTAPTDAPVPSPEPLSPATLDDAKAAPDQPESARPEDPLAELLQRPEASGLVLTATAQPDQQTLVLQVSPAFAALPLSSQQRSAELWQQWAADLGYDHLELRDSRSGLLARDALVGSGMIVLSEPPRP